MVNNIDIEEFLKRKGELLIGCHNKHFKNKGISTLKDLLEEEEINKNPRTVQIIKLVKAKFDKELIEIASEHIEGITNEGNRSTNIIIINEKNISKKVENIPCSELQRILKKIQNKVEEPDFTKKLKIDHFDIKNILEVRKKCKNVKLRSIY
jgi:hypothetical protein